jgi:hypothetical protein
MHQNVMQKITSDTYCFAQFVKVVSTPSLNTCPILDPDSIRSCNWLPVWSDKHCTQMMLRLIHTLFVKTLNLAKVTSKDIHPTPPDTPQTHLSPLFADLVVIYHVCICSYKMK